MLLGALLACARPEMITADVAITDPEPDTEFCQEDLPVSADVTTDSTIASDAVLLAWFGDFSSDQEDDIDLDDNLIRVLAVHGLSADEHEGQLSGAVKWSDVEDAGEGRVLLAADVGQFGGQFAAGDSLTVQDYEDMVGPTDLYARATVSVRTCF
jgi:hypothetical protein